MKFQWLVLLVMLLSLPASALDLPAMTFNDQWNKQQTLDESTQLVILSNHKEGGKWVRQSFEAMSINNLSAKHWLYVADISKMPSLITRMFALPKMRDYSFAVSLVREQSSIKDWPIKEAAVAVYRLHQLAVESVVYFTNQAELQTFLQDLEAH